MDNIAAGWASVTLETRVRVGLLQSPQFGERTPCRVDDVCAQPYTEGGGIPFVQDWSSLLSLLEHDVIRVQALLLSPYVVHVGDRCRAWEAKLRKATDFVERWQMCQRDWVVRIFVPLGHVTVYTRTLLLMCVFGRRRWSRFCLATRLFVCCPLLDARSLAWMPHGGAR
jgi:hypothetical protein